MKKFSFMLPVLMGVIAVVVSDARAVKIADITRFDGQRTNKLQGVGLVVGLRGTGDGGNFPAAINPLVSLLKNNADPVTAKDLANAQNVAVVWCEATVGADRARDGDKLNVHVTSLGASQSLRGGRLVLAPLQGPIPGSGIFAMASGPVVIEDPTSPTAGVVEKGAVMETDLPAKYVDNGRLTLILDDASASWTTSSAIAKVINDSESTSGETLAVAVDPKNIVVTLPTTERERPDSFISRIERLPVPLLPTEARVQLNERTGTMIVTGDVEISPVVISHKGLTISTVLPPPVPTQRNPVVDSKNMVVLDTANQGGARLRDLVNALDQLKVSAEDRITIIKELYKTGKLHAKLIVE